MDVHSSGRFLMEQRFIPDCALTLQETGFRIMNVHPAVSVSVGSVRQIIDRFSLIVGNDISFICFMHPAWNVLMGAFFF